MIECDHSWAIECDHSWRVIAESADGVSLRCIICDTYDTMFYVSTERLGFITGDWSVEYPPIAEQPPSYGGWSGYVACI